MWRGPHKHLAGAHTYVISGKLESRAGVVNAGDYAYEPIGMVHDATTALEDTIYLFIALGPLLLFDDDAFTGYVDWEVIERLRNKTGGQHVTPHKF
jgi:quercetin dioxygenase-like cupin family protein